MKKRLLLLTAIVDLALLVGISVIPENGTFFSYANTENSTPDCETLKKTMPSIQSILTTEYNDNVNHYTYNEYSTWGTVTAIYVQSNKYHAFIQNKGNESSPGAMCLYNLGLTSSPCPLEVGDFVTVHGSVTYYRGMYEILMDNEDNSYTVMKNITSYPVEPVYVTTSDVTASKGSTIWNNSIVKGNIRVAMNNLTITSVTSTYALVKANNTGNNIKLYYGGIGETTNIKNKIQNAYSKNQDINIIGYLSCFDNTSSEMQILLRYATDITPLIINSVPVESINISVSENKIEVGGTAEAAVSFYPMNASNQNVTWSSNNTSIAKVDANGVITGVGVGTAKITATAVSDSTIKDTVYIFVNPARIAVSSITIDKSGYDFDDDNFLNISVGDTGVISASVLPSNATDKVIHYVSMYDCIDIDEYTGEWTAVSEGETIISAYSNDDYSIRDSFYVNVHDNSYPTLSSFNVNDSYSLNVGETITIDYSTSPIDFPYELISIEPEKYYEDYFEVDNVTSSSFDITGLKSGSGYILISYDLNGTKEYKKYVYVNVVQPKEEIDSISFSSVSPGTYKSNFGTSYIGDYGVKYAYYRVGKVSNYWKLYPSCNLVSALDDSLPGSFSNETSSYAMKFLSISYSGEGTLRYGADKNCTSSKALNKSTSETTVKVDTNNAFFFYIEADKGTTLSLYDLDIAYNTSISYSSSNAPMERVNTRIPATTYSGSLIDGVSYVDVPTSISVSGGKYTVTSTKRYTYYSFDYIYENRNSIDVSSYALTDPIDVANYYIAFKCAPVNYYATNTVTRVNNSIGSKTEISQLFGSKTRCVSQYSRTDGYATGLPYYGSPTYLEFDFDGNGSYSTTSRDVCRVVLWSTGWNGSGYNNGGVPVATYTDDHYVTFREYNNYGGWNLPFDSINNGSYTQDRTNYVYGSTNTLVKA